METPHHTLTIDEANDYLDAVADGIPQDILQDLNGGIVLSPATVRSPEGPGLFTLGTYHVDPYGLGRYVVIYYGSFRRVHGHEPLQAQKKALRDVLFHELTHHMESLAGVRDLEVKDEIFLENYHRAQQENPPKPPPEDAANRKK